MTELLLPRGCHTRRDQQNRRGGCTYGRTPARLARTRSSVCRSSCLPARNAASARSSSTQAVNFDDSLTADQGIAENVGRVFRRRSVSMIAQQCFEPFDRVWLAPAAERVRSEEAHVDNVGVGRLRHLHVLIQRIDERADARRDGYRSFAVGRLDGLRAKRGLARENHGAGRVEQSSVQRARSRS